MLRKSDFENEITFFEGNILSVTKELEILTKKVPKGAKPTLCQTQYKYFMRTNSSDINGEYIKVKDRKSAVILAQIEYYEILTKSDSF